MNPAAFPLRRRLRKESLLEHCKLSVGNQTGQLHSKRQKRTHNLEAEAVVSQSVEVPSRSMGESAPQEGVKPSIHQEQQSLPYPLVILGVVVDPFCSHFRPDCRNTRRILVEVSIAPMPSWGNVPSVS